MIPATSITITRAEGRPELCGKPETFTGPTCWADAKNWLWRQSYSFPRSGGYDKHDLRVVFEDGEVWDGRLDCQHFTCDGNDLDPAAHVLVFLLFRAGQSCPGHMSPERYEQYLTQAELRRPGSRASAREFLNTYQIGDAS